MDCLCQCPKTGRNTGLVSALLGDIAHLQSNLEARRAVTMFRTARLGCSATREHAWLRHLLCHEREGTPRSACARCAPHAVHIVLRVDGDVIVDHHIYSRDVQASASNICTKASQVKGVIIYHSAAMSSASCRPVSCPESTLQGCSCY